MVQVTEWRSGKEMLPETITIWRPPLEQKTPPEYGLKKYNMAVQDKHYLDADGRPAGGWGSSPGAAIRWHDGPIMRLNPTMVPEDWQAAVRKEVRNVQLDPDYTPILPIGYCCGLAPLGAQVVEVLQLCLQRLQFLQLVPGGKFACAENAESIRHILLAIEAQPHVSPVQSWLEEKRAPETGLP